MSKQIAHRNTSIYRCPMSPLAKITLLFAAVLSASTAIADETQTDLPDFAHDIRPILHRACIDCHSSDNAEADIDLSQFNESRDVSRENSVWVKTRAMIRSHQMPPKDAEPLSDDEHRLLLSWVEQYLRSAAKANAGDPGPVMLRRLNNEEYRYTIGDLTGVSSLNPTAEFPVDGAAGEGFINTGEAQAMSPALVSKYLDAARLIASHAVLTPQGIDFSEFTSRRDWTDERVQDIRDFYLNFTEFSNVEMQVSGAGSVPNEGGAIPYAKYLHALKASQTDLRAGEQSILDIADHHSLNPQYLGFLWARLSRTDPQNGVIVNQIAKQFSEADVDQVLKTVKALQQATFRFNSIGHVGGDGKPKRWMERVSPVLTNQSVNFALPAEPESDIAIHLTISDANDGSDSDIVILRNPRITIENDVDVPLASIQWLQQHADELNSEKRNLNELIERSIPDSRFGSSESLEGIGKNDLVVQAPAKLAFTIPQSIAQGRTLQLDAVLHDAAGKEGSVCIEVALAAHNSNSLPLATPVLVHPRGQKQQSVRDAFDLFCDCFPPLVCYSRIVPVDEVVTLSLYYRQDDDLQRLMLDDQQKKTLDQMWDEMLFVAQEPLRYEVAFEQLREFATQDRPDLVKVWDPLKPDVVRRANEFRQRQIDLEPLQVDSALRLASQAWRRPLSEPEQRGLSELYQSLRGEDLPHEKAIELLLTRIFASPAFLYRREVQPEGSGTADVSAIEYANRLSFFFWSSMPDEKLMRSANAGELSNPATLGAEIDRLLSDEKTRRLAIQFACQWLHLRNFSENDDKNEKLYPEFASLRHDMYEETILFFEHLFRNNGSILEILDADYAYVNRSLAAHYGIEDIDTDGWVRLDGVQKQGRGGILAMATVLASQSGASRTSPILRGNYVFETLLGERLPRPPADVPQLPEELPKDLSARELIEQHSAAPQCAKCHELIDPFGFALEQYDAIGRLRPIPVDTATVAADGTAMDGINGLREYLLHDRRDAFVRQFCRKLLGFALGRAVQLSDEVLLDEMQQRLKNNDYRFRVAIESIVTSQPFRQIRCADFSPPQSPAYLD
ncbi:DUF1592 domain-containing protein [Stieleria sp. JC731]|uniref:DUF1592 domain-containing protein n=2 Tax=Pirellulaceae TaxID=2691357 RepID=UPI001E3CB311|nr:DUF1592 domain-containing protein [Stieleria sp. JC731]MCC9601324.1 DUF1592 domain-containing protein [Stieleria sp. JC731]